MVSGSPGSSVLRPGPENRRHSGDLDRGLSHSEDCHDWGECPGFNLCPSHFSQHIWRWVSLCPLYRGGNRPGCGGWGPKEIRAQETGNHLIPHPKLSSEVLLDPRGLYDSHMRLLPQQLWPSPPRSLADCHRPQSHLAKGNPHTQKTRRVRPTQEGRFSCQLSQAPLGSSSTHVQPSNGH